MDVITNQVINLDEIRRKIHFSNHIGPLTSPKDYCVVKLRGIKNYNMHASSLNKVFINHWYYTDMPNSVDEFTYYIAGDYRVDTDAMLKQWAERYKIAYKSGKVNEYNIINHSWSKPFKGSKKAITWFEGDDGKLYQHIDGEINEI